MGLVNVGIVSRAGDRSICFGIPKVMMDGLKYVAPDIDEHLAVRRVDRRLSKGCRDAFGLQLQ